MTENLRERVESALARNQMRFRDLEWSAGFLEGEGSFIESNSACRVTAPQMQRAPLERLHGLFGGSLTQRRDTHLHVWQLSGVAAAGLMMTLYGLMSPRRRGQIFTALSRWRRAGVHHRFRYTCRLGHPLVRLANQQGPKYRHCPICEARNKARIRIRTPQDNRTLPMWQGESA